MKDYEEDYYVDKPEPRPAYRAHQQEFGCEFCWDNRTKKDIEIFYFDRANNMRVCQYCPSCGREFK